MIRDRFFAYLSEDTFEVGAGTGHDNDFSAMNTSKRTPLFPLLTGLVGILFTGAVQADCPELKRPKLRLINETVSCFNSKLADLQHGGSAALGESGASDLAVMAQLAELKKDVDYLKGLPPASPIGSFENELMKVEVAGLAKVVDPNTGKATISASFQITNKSNGALNIAMDNTFGFTATSNGIVARCSEGDCASGIPANTTDPDDTESKPTYSTIPRSSGLTFGLMSKALPANMTQQLGERFGLTFNLQRAKGGAVDTYTVSFSGIAATY